MSELLDSFAPAPDVHGRHATLVKAPADLVLEVARNFDMQSIPSPAILALLRDRDHDDPTTAPPRRAPRGRAAVAGRSLMLIGES